MECPGWRRRERRDEEKEEVRDKDEEATMRGDG